MRYLELAELSQLNNLLIELQSDDGSKITGKAAGQDKKLLKKLALKYPDGISDEVFRDLSMEESGLTVPSSPGGPWSPSAIETPKQTMPLKLFYFLVATMNLMFPDYDFSDVCPSVFERLPVVSQVINMVNSTIFNTGANKNYESFSEFTRSMWDCIDQAIELYESEIYTFVPDQGPAEIDDPFWEKGSIWAINYFFWNKKQKRLLVLQLRCINPLNPDGEFFEYPISQRSVTPI